MNYKLTVLILIGVVFVYKLLLTLLKLRSTHNVFLSSGAQNTNARNVTGVRACALQN